MPAHPTASFVARRIPRMVRIRKAHPTEPVVVRLEGVEPRDRPIGHPVGVVHVPGYGVVLGLRSAGVASPGAVESHGGEVDEGKIRVAPLRTVGLQPMVVVPCTQVSVHSRLHVLEAAVGTGGSLSSQSVLGPVTRGIEAGLKVSLADERRPVPSAFVQPARHRRRVFGQRHPVGENPVGTDVLTCDHGRPGRHAHRVLVVGAAVVDPVGSQTVGHRSPGHRAAVAAEGVVTLLVGRHEEDVASHAASPTGSFG